PEPANSVSRWMRSQPPPSLFTTTICEAEIYYGIALMRVGRRRTNLERAVTAIFEEDFGERILPFDRAAARAFAAIAAQRRALGSPDQPIGRSNCGDYPFAGCHSRYAQCCRFRRLRDSSRQPLGAYGIESPGLPKKELARLRGRASCFL